MEDLIALPAPPLRDRRLPSPAEQLFAGRYLHLTGLILFLGGLLSFMRLSGGRLHSLAGLAIGALMLAAGDRCYRQGLKEYAQGLVGGGLGVLLVTLCATHFYWNLIGLPELAAGLTALVALSGVAVCRYDSQALGNLTLAGLLAAPFLMHFKFSGFGAIFAYLVAVNVGVTLVAFVKRWDFQLLACLVGSYALYFHFFGQERPRLSMLFLAVVYGLFLVSNNLLHFLRPGSSECNLGLSYVNPTVFAVASYYVLEQLSNLAPVAVYLTLAAAHLGLYALAERRGNDDPSFGELATNNKIMGLLFLAASVSFVNHFYDRYDTKSYSALATVLWFGLAFALQACKGRIERRYGMLCLFLTMCQQLTVIPELPEGRLPLQFASLAFYLLYAWRSRGQETEDRQAGVASLGAAALLTVCVGALPYLGALIALAASLRWLRTLSLKVLLRAAHVTALIALLATGNPLLWGLAALASLRTLTSLSVVMLTLAFLQSVLFDWSTLNLGLVVVLIAASRRAPQPDQKTLFTLLALLDFAFQTTVVLHHFYGILDEFQIILSAFWCLAGFLFVAAGLHLTAPVPRLFGLTILVGSAAKMCVVDLWLLNAYTQTTTLTILGAILMATGFLYQRCHEVEDGAPSPPDPRRAEEMQFA